MVLAKILSASNDAGLVDGEVPPMTAATYYFRFYLARAVEHAGMGDSYLELLGPWKQMLSLGLTTWAETCPFVTWQREVLRPYVHPSGPQANADREAPRFDTPATLEAALQQAGFERMQILVEEGEFVHANDEEVWARLWSGGPRRQLEQMTGPVLDQVKRDVIQKVQVFKQPDGIHILRQALCALGDKPHR